MSLEEELIFGLYRYINKASRYVGNKSVDEFIHDEMAFDATCFAFDMIKYISEEIQKNKYIITNYPSINFEKISNFYPRVFIHDSINYMEMYEIVVKEFPVLQMELYGKLRK